MNESDQTEFRFWNRYGSATFTVSARGVGVAASGDVEMKIDDVRALAGWLAAAPETHLRCQHALVAKAFDAGSGAVPDARLRRALEK